MLPSRWGTVTEADRSISETCFAPLLVCRSRSGFAGRHAGQPGVCRGLIRGCPGHKSRTPPNSAVIVGKRRRALAARNLYGARKAGSQCGSARETQPPNRASSSRVGRRPCGVSLSTKPGTSCDSCAVTSCSDKPVFSDKALIMDGPSADPSEPG